MRVRHWGESSVVFHELTTTTHLLDAGASMLLQVLLDSGRDGAHGADAITLWRIAFGTGRDAAPDENQRLMLDANLQRLAEVGLAVAIDP